MSSLPNNNPLKQYFRRPAVYLKLPSGGKYYEPGVVDIPDIGEIPVYPMTAIDDITVRTPDALFNGSAIVEIIKSCVPNIKDPWKINAIDLDAVLIAIRNASGDGKMSIDSECPKCQNVGSFEVNLMAALSQIKAGNYDDYLTINELKIKFRPLVYLEMNQAANLQLEVQKRFIELQELNETDRAGAIKQALTRVTEVTMDLLVQSIEYIETPGTKVDSKEYILDFLRNCDKDVYVSIRDYNASLKEGTQLKPLHIKCTECSNEYDQEFTLNASDFFG